MTYNPNDYPEFPKPGAKLKYKGTHPFWFTNYIQDAKDKLVVGQEYTLKTIEILSSWCCVTLEETGDTEFALSFFTYESQA